MAPQTRETAITDQTIHREVSQRKEIYHEGYFYDVTDWIRRHPGGKIIEFYTKSGEDATIAVQQFHKRSMKKVLGIMSSLKKRPATLSECKIPIYRKCLLFY